MHVNLQHLFFRSEGARRSTTEGCNGCSRHIRALAYSTEGSSLMRGDSAVTNGARSDAAAGVEVGQTSGQAATDSVTVVLPCLNEEDSVGLVVDEALRALQGAGIPGEVLVVD